MNCSQGEADSALAGISGKEFWCQNIKKIGAEYIPVGFSDPVLNEGSDDAFTASLRKPLCSLTDLNAKVTFTPDIYFIFIFSVSSFLPLISW